MWTGGAGRDGSGTADTWAVDLAGGASIWPAGRAGPGSGGRLASPPPDAWNCTARRGARTSAAGRGSAVRSRGEGCRLPPRATGSLQNGENRPSSAAARRAGRDLGEGRWEGGGQAPSGPRVPGVQGSCSLLPPGPSCESPEEHLANICRISECISESRTTEISWTNTGLEEVYIFV